jgi:hypothetical protein
MIMLPCCNGKENTLKGILFSLLAIILLNVTFSVFAKTDVQNQIDHFEFNKTSEAGLQWFISRYENNDHGNLIPQAKVLLEDLTTYAQLDPIEKQFKKLTTASQTMAFLRENNATNRQDLLKKAKSKLSQFQISEAKTEYSYLRTRADYVGFIYKYSKKDYAGLIPSAKDKVLQLDKQKQQSDFDKSATMFELKTFLKDYSDRDFLKLLSPAKTKILELEKQVSEFRKVIEIGDDTNCGLVAEIKGPLVRVESVVGLK